MLTRSHTGCWTCKRRRRRCDNGRPACQNCRERRVDCEGYEVRLKWGAGIASRGRFTGADKPIQDSVPPRQKGRQRDLGRKEKEKENRARDPDGSQLEARRTKAEDAIFDEFMNDGINTLHSTTARDSMLHPRLPQLCQESNALYPICIAFQLALSSTVTPQFCEYFDTALRTFRSELACSTTLSDATLTSGLLLSNAWLALDHASRRHAPNPAKRRSRQRRSTISVFFRLHLLEVMGVMDLHCSAVGRQSPHIGIWRRYCQLATPRHGVEPVSGLPRTLLDIFAGIGIETTEQTFWDWPGEPGSFLQCYLWEAHRLAGILTLRRDKAHVPLPESISAWRQPAKCPADTTVLVARILASIDALRLASIERPLEDAYIRNAIILPVFIAGLEIDVLCRKPEWQQMIRTSLRTSHQCEILLGLLEEIWQRADPSLSVHDLARQRGIEMGLL
ncbi:hypothetical protein N7452_004958 [Penicillium brevicompactum]|uniref:Zn(2)-C6 fungal-type domain-containing protein n=1 Tax=Penicillium brevicompactum TaxID=5074 RepID=A0A9W9QJ12_PENBR|nr:hypothetical protein N7452_004958 [Penicillium brevicompactum]